MGGLQLHNNRNAPTEGTAGFQGLPEPVAPRALRLDNDNGWRGGVVAGWNGSAGSLVYGAEADVTFGPNRASTSFSGAGIPGLAPDGLTTSASRRIGTSGSLRARLGTTLGENALLYATGGVALANVRGTVDVVVNGVDYQVGLPTAGGAARIGIIARF